MRAITKLTLLMILTVGLLAAPLALASGPGDHDDAGAAGRARGEGHRANATAAGDDHRADATERAERNTTSDRANMTAARSAWRENASLVRASWHENATAVRTQCRATEIDHANATEEQQTAWAQCIQTGYSSWREANAARFAALRDLFLAFLGARGHMGN